MTRPTRITLDALRRMTTESDLGRTALSLAGTYLDDGALASAARASRQAAEHFDAAQAAREAATRAEARAQAKERFKK